MIAITSFELGLFIPLPVLMTLTLFNNGHSDAGKVSLKVILYHKFWSDRAHMVVPYGLGHHAQNALHDLGYIYLTRGIIDVFLVYGRL